MPMAIGFDPVRKFGKFRTVEDLIPAPEVECCLLTSRFQMDRYGHTSQSNVQFQPREQIPLGVLPKDRKDRASFKLRPVGLLRLA